MQKIAIGSLLSVEAHANSNIINNNIIENNNDLEDDESEVEIDF